MTFDSDGSTVDEELFHGLPHGGEPLGVIGDGDYDDLAGY